MVMVSKWLQGLGPRLAGQDFDAPSDTSGDRLTGAG
jgi:hypothetical protein